jgi:hypothetical protein
VSKRKAGKTGRAVLKIVSIAEEPLEQIPYVSAAAGGQGISYEWLPVYWGEILELPQDVDALIVASNLQGMAIHPVWKAFRNKFGTVLGVNGNHDLLSREGQAELTSHTGIHLFSEPDIIRQKGYI